MHRRPAIPNRHPVQPRAQRSVRSTSSPPGQTANRAQRRQNQQPPPTRAR